jgi:hypothetical protein
MEVYNQDIITIFEPGKLTQATDFKNTIRYGLLSALTKINEMQPQMFQQYDSLYKIINAQNVIFLNPDFDVVLYKDKNHVVITDISVRDKEFRKFVIGLKKFVVDVKDDLYIRVTTQQTYNQNSNTIYKELIKFDVSEINNSDNGESEGLTTRKIIKYIIILLVIYFIYKRFF